MSKWIPTPESSNLAGFSYEKTTKVLTVKFKNDSLYDYISIPESIFEEMKKADSKGRYLNKHIKEVYKFKKQKCFV